MRIVTKIAAAGVSGLSRFPCLKASIDGCLNACGRLDKVKVLRALDSDQIQIGSKDDLRTLAFGLEYITQIEVVVRRLADKLNQQGEVRATVSGPEKGIRSEAATPGDFRCERNMNKGRFAFVRTDITSCSDGIHVRLTIQNPRGIVGNAEIHAWNHAVMCARILVYLQEVITTSPVVLLEGDGAKGVFAEAERMNRLDDLAQKRASCAHLRNGFCSPVCPTCPLYSNGQCKAPR